MPDDPEGSDNSDDLNLPPPFFPYENEPPTERTFCEMEVDGVYAVDEEGQSRRLIVMLVYENFALHISIGNVEARSITVALDKSMPPPDRPHTHDLMKTLLDRTGWELEMIQIDDLFHEVYYAKLVLKNEQGTLVVESRPSDAIALALRMDAPIMVDTKLLEEEE